jgi:hypothetical protein
MLLRTTSQRLFCLLLQDKKKKLARLRKFLCIAGGRFSKLGPSLLLHTEAQPRCRKLFPTTPLIASGESLRAPHFHMSGSYRCSCLMVHVTSFPRDSYERESRETVLFSFPYLSLPSPDSSACRSPWTTIDHGYLRILVLYLDLLNSLNTSAFPLFCTMGSS